MTSPNPTRSWPMVDPLGRGFDANPEGGAEDELRLDRLEPPVGGEGDARGLVAARPGGEARDVDQRVEPAGRGIRRESKTEGDQLGAVAAWRDVVGPFVFCPGAPHDEGAVGAVRILVELVGAQIELGRKQIVHALALRQLAG